MRWLSRDPVGEGGGINLYQFVTNNPIVFLDALGENPLVLVPVFSPGGAAATAGIAEAIGVTFGIGAISVVADQIITAMGKGGNQHVGDTGLRGKSNAEISNGARDKTMPQKERQRYIREDKFRKNRNKSKRNCN